MFDNRVIIPISFMSRVISKKNTFTSFVGQFISFLRREENKIDTRKSTKTGVIKRMTMHMSVQRKRSNSGGWSDVDEQNCS